MNWENKFSSILRETESNLSKARRKLYTPGHGYLDLTSRGFSSSMPMRRSSSLLDMSGYVPVMTSTPQVAVPSQPSITSPQLVNSLQEKMEQQNRLIDQLMQMVNKLETDRNNYSEQMKDVRDQLYHLRTQNTKPDRRMDVENKIDQFRRDLQSEINSIHIQLQRNSVDNTLQRDIRDMKNNVQDDLDLMKRDIDILKSRIGKIENEVSTIARNPRRMSHYEKVQNQQTSLNTTTDSWGRVRDQYQIQDLRSSVSTLKNKLDNLEYSLGSGGSTPRQKYTPNSGIHTPLYINAKSPQLYDNGYKSEKSGNSVMDLDDLDLSDDDESTDFEMFNPQRAKISSTVIDSDEDLNLSDLDLSDDDPIGDPLVI
ncbi:uncharacterized protein LOC125671519 [Ostrea edulis]|uniref:uncharacterized protein LOC125671519 n=1 Tax=Ostrea edulis TaxID=37623 RepID=UPI0020957D39|nr:uncharacterized protein LOC125671519 [Ostrea edulis]